MNASDQHQEHAFRVFLLGAGFSNENMGVRALAAGAIRSFLHQFPDASLSLLDYAKEPTTFNLFVGQREVNISLINIRFSKRLFLSNNIATLLLIGLVARLLPLKHWRNWLLDGNHVLRELRRADVILSVAGGDSFSDIYGLTRLIYVALPQLLALIIGIQLVLLPQTIGPFKTRLGRRIARLILSRASSIYCRDYVSMQVTESIVGPGSRRATPQFCYDMAFALEAASTIQVEMQGLQERAHRRNALVGVNVSGLLAMGGYTKANMFGLKISYVDL